MVEQKFFILSIPYDEKSQGGTSAHKKSRPKAAFLLLFP